MIGALLLGIAWPAAGVAADFRVDEVKVQFSARHGSRNRVFYASGFLSSTPTTSEYKSLQLIQQSLDGKTREPLLDASLAEELRTWVSQGTMTRNKGYGLTSVIHDRWLVTQANMYRDVDEEAVRVVVFDTHTNKALAFDGYGYKKARSSVRAVGPGWAVLNYVPPHLTGQVQTEFSKMYLFEGDKRTEIGFGTAAGADARGRIYATEYVNRWGKTTFDEDPDATRIFKVYENGAWRKIGEGIIQHVRADGTLLITQPMGDVSLAKDGKWSKVKMTWDPSKVSPTFVADNGAILLVGMHRVDPAFPGHDGAILFKGKVTELDSLLPEGSVYNRPEMSPDGTVLVRVRSKSMDKPYLITPR